jgi:hypothetical protein
LSGIILVSALAGKARPRPTCRAIAETIAEPLRPANPFWHVLVDQDHLCLATLAPRADGGPQRVQRWSTRRVAVAMLGYLARPRPAQNAPTDAEIVAQQLAERGPKGVESLRGAFVIAAFDEQARTATVWTDHAGTRPCYLCQTPHVVMLAPSPRCFRKIPGAPSDLVPGSLAAMTLNGALLDEHTYYRGVRLVGPARRVTLERAGTRWTHYWQRTFDPPNSRPDPTPESVAEQICHATDQHLARFEDPLLALSGGLDSRILLAACRRLGRNIPTITWGFDHVDTPGSDYAVGQAAARHAGVPHHAVQLDVNQLPQHAQRVVELTDGLTGHLGNYTRADQLARELATEHDAIIRGDEMFGWAKRVNSATGALSRVGVNLGKRLRLLRFLLNRDVAPAVLRDYEQQYREVVSALPDDAPPDDLKDMLYWKTRYPRLIASQAAVFRAHLDVVSPLLDPGIIDLVRGCSAAERENKCLIERCGRAAFADDFEIPLNTVHSRASWRTRFRTAGTVQRFFVETLLEPLESFDAWFDRTAIRAWLAAALPDGKLGQWPRESHWFTRRVAELRALLLRPAFKERVIVNLTTLKLWFKRFG